MIYTYTLYIRLLTLTYTTLVLSNNNNVKQISKTLGGEHLILNKSAIY